jgi:hypothetical protein
VQGNGDPTWCTREGAGKVQGRCREGAGKVQGNGDPTWCTERKPPAFEGVHFENVETIFTEDVR